MMNDHDERMMIDKTTSSNGASTQVVLTEPTLSS